MEKGYTNGSVWECAGPSTANENVVEKPLSPVLSKKRYSRKLVEKKIGTNKLSPKNIQDNENSYNSNIEKRPDRSGRASAIPVLVERKSSTKSPCNEEPSCSFITTANNLKGIGFCTASGRSISVSESKIREHKQLFADILNFHTGDDTELNSTKQNLELISTRIPVQNAIISNPSNTLERSQFINRVHKPPNKLNMIYENKEFELSPMSKTTVFEALVGNVDSAGAIENEDLKNTEVVLNYIQRTPVAQRVKSGEGGENTLLKDVNKCQTNYNYGDDDSITTSESEFIEVSKLVERPLQNPNGLVRHQETDTCLAFTSQALENIKKTNLNEERYKFPHAQSKKYETVDNLVNSQNEDTTEELELLGFTRKEIAEGENQYDTFKTMCGNYEKKTTDELRRKAHKKSKHFNKTEISQGTGDLKISKIEKRKRVKEIQLRAEELPKKFWDLSQKMFPNIEAFEKQIDDTNSKDAKEVTVIESTTTRSYSGSDTISLPSSNRLQICIGNNRIKINIKADCEKRIEAIGSHFGDVPKDNLTNQNAECETSQSTCTQNIYSNPYIGIFNCGDFKSAAGKPIEISSNLMEKAEQLFKEIPFTPMKEIDNCISKPPLNDSIHNICGIKKQSREFSGPSESNSETSKQLGFQSASGQPIEISEETLQKAYKLFEQVDFQSDMLPRRILKPKSLLKCRPELGRPSHLQKTSRKSLQFANQPVQNSNASISSIVQFGTDKLNVDFTSDGFSFVSGKNVETSKENIHKGLKIFNHNELSVLELRNKDFIDKEDSNINPLLNVTIQKKTAPELIQDVVNSYDTALGKIELSSHGNAKENRPQSSKKTLGIPCFKTIPISLEKLEIAKKVFGDDTFTTIKNIPLSKFTSYSYTPERVSNSEIQKVQYNTSTLKTGSYEGLQINKPPIKKSEVPEELSHQAIIFREKSVYNFNQLQNDIEREYAALKRKLDILDERKVLLQQQRQLIEKGSEAHRRPKLGILSKNKANAQRVPLKELFNLGDQNIDYFNIAPHILQVTPRISEKLHFNLKFDEQIAAIRTTDGAIVIPNSQNIIGITEIENAFNATSGVDPLLLPMGWVHNHYKLIIWKLASYERRFPQYFKDCLSIENVIQQLKFRYDLEIDKSKRSALRKILEKDDVPQKRLVLCVWDIIQIFPNKFELELTDGWYIIRTVVDNPLSEQICMNKILIGSKLIIVGAELINCDDGCHPINVMDNARLKIGFNGTRKAAWHLKLGYYKIPTPFSIPLRSVHPDGGLVSLLNLFIARVYPIRYLEKCNNMKFWRNVRAEERRAREYEIEKEKEIEALNYQAYKEYENENNQHFMDKKLSISEIGKTKCPATLFNLIQKSNDPESIIEMLSSTQQQSVIDYKHTFGSQKENEIAFKIKTKIEELNANKRSVVAVLKLLVIDAQEHSDVAYNLSIWRPTEEHLNLLKENAAFRVYNLCTRGVCELSSTNKTYFEAFYGNILTHEKIQRQLLPIAMTMDNYYKPHFNEFDTVGLITQIVVNDHNQELWLSDFVGRLLFVKILEGPKMCALIDNLRRGQSVALTNLSKGNIQSNFGTAIANQFTVISQYPSQKYLQMGLEIFNKQLPEDISKLLSDADRRIENIRNDVDLKLFDQTKNNAAPWNLSQFNDLLEDDSFEDNSVIPSRLTMTDVAMSLIADQYTR